MKKIILTLVVLFISICYISCNSMTTKTKKTNTKTFEYTIDEFLEISHQMTADYEEQTKYLTDEEIEENDIISKIAKKHNLPLNSTVELRGKVICNSVYPNSFYLVSQDTTSVDYDTQNYVDIYCEDRKSFALNGEIVVVKGKLTLYNVLSNCEIVSPSEVEHNALDNNMFDIYFLEDKYDLPYGKIVGEVSAILDLETASQAIEDLDEFISESSTHVAVISDNKNTDHDIFCVLEINEEYPINAGDAIAICGDIYTFADGSYYIKNTSCYYVYD